MHITFYNFYTKKFRRPQESGENCLRTYDNQTQAVEKCTINWNLSANFKTQICLCLVFVITG